MKWFKVNGIGFNVRVFEPKETFTILYSDNTGRTIDDGAPMILDPLGTFFNYTMTVGAMKGYEEEFESLWNLISTPAKEPLLFVFPKMSPKHDEIGNGAYWKTTGASGEEVQGFYAYVSVGERGIKRIIEDSNGELQDVIYDSFTINFIAMKAQVLPSE